MNVIARLEYKLAYYDSAVHRFNHYTTRTPPIYLLNLSVTNRMRYRVIFNTAGLCLVFLLQDQLPYQECPIIQLKGKSCSFLAHLHERKCKLPHPQFDLKSSSSSSCHAASTDLPNPLPPPVSIVHRFKATSGIGAELLYVRYSRSSCVCSSI